MRRREFIAARLCGRLAVAQQITHSVDRIPEARAIPFTELFDCRKLELKKAPRQVSTESVAVVPFSTIAIFETGSWGQAELWQRPHAAGAALRAPEQMAALNRCRSPAEEQSSSPAVRPRPSPHPQTAGAATHPRRNLAIVIARRPGDPVESNGSVSTGCTGWSRRETTANRSLNPIAITRAQ